MGITGSIRVDGLNGKAWEMHGGTVGRGEITTIGAIPQNGPAIFRAIGGKRLNRRLGTAKAG